MTNYVKSWSVVLFCFVALLSLNVAHATTNVLVNDKFTTDGLANGRTPDTTDAPGSMWMSSVGTTGGELPAGFDTGTIINIASTGLYTKPSVMTISADIDLNGMTGGTQNVNDFTAPHNNTIVRGITLGFFITTDTTHAGGFDTRRAPLGITYNDLGYLLLVRPNSPGANNGNADILASVNTYGPDNTTVPLTGSHHISYTIDTSTGVMTNATFDGQAINFGYNTTGLFTDALTDWAGNYASSGSGNNGGFMDNFLLTTPEPASLSLLAVGGLLLVRRRRA